MDGKHSEWWCCWSPDCEIQGWGNTPQQAYAEWGRCAVVDFDWDPMTDKQKRIQALYHLEVCFEPMGKNGRRKPQEWADAHITAAHYLIQSMFGGSKPQNYDDVMRRAAEFDAIDEANCAIHVARNA